MTNFWWGWVSMQALCVLHSRIWSDLWSSPVWPSQSRGCCSCLATLYRSAECGVSQLGSFSAKSPEPDRTCWCAAGGSVSEAQEDKNRPMWRAVETLMRWIYEVVDPTMDEPMLMSVFQPMQWRLQFELEASALHYVKPSILCHGYHQ